MLAIVYKSLAGAYAKGCPQLLLLPLVVWPFRSSQGKDLRLTAASAVCRPPTPAELLRAVALARGWVVGNGLPDEARAGRLLLKDYTAGKLVHCEEPPRDAAHAGATDEGEQEHEHPNTQPRSSHSPSEGVIRSSTTGVHPWL